MNNPDMLVSVRGSLDIAEKHITEHYFPIRDYKLSNNIANSTALFLNLCTDLNSDTTHFLSVFDSTITALSQDEYESLAAKCVNDNCTLYNKSVPCSFKPGRYIINI